jgi:hypothetical protein
MRKHRQGHGDAFTEENVNKKDKEEKGELEKQYKLEQS